TAEIEITGSRAQRNFNLYANEEDLKYINSIDNKNIIMAWQSNYLKDNPSGPLWATKGPNSVYGFAVNPWPNENDMLSVIKLNGSHNKKEFVQGQTITTDIIIENLDDNARERLVGQVYHPVTGEVVPGAKTYINDQDKVVIEMPQGAIDENGNINEDSIFYKDPSYKALQNLEVKFFARPRTAEEFTKIANDNEGTYTSTGAGTATINHKGENVEIDLQGIDRYDRYNLIGSFKINLDDTRYYDQGFIDGNDDDTSKHTSSKVSPGEEFEVNLYVPEDKKDKDLFPNQKTPEEMEAAKDRNEAVGTIDMSFIDRENKGKAPEDQWKLDYDKDTLPTTLKITPPKSAKAGEFVAVPLTYTYTNGSNDVHWFHFVVQESTNNRPEYYVQVEYPSEEQKSNPEVPKDDKKLSPVSYSIPEGTEFKDDKGNVWTVSIDEKTGEVTAKPNNPSQFDGGEKLQVPVVAHYKDPSDPDKDITEETTAEFVIKEKYNLDVRYNAKVGKAGDELSSDLIVDQNDKFNRKPTKFTLDSNTFTDDKGNTWTVTIDEDTGKVTATVPNAKEGKTIDGALLNVPVTAHYYETGSDNEIAAKKVEVQFIASGSDGTVEKTEKIPFSYDVQYDPDFYTKYPEATDNFKIVTEGEAGEKKTTWTIKDSQIVGEPEVVVTKNPVDAVIKVGQKDFNGTFTSKETSTIQFKTQYIVDKTLEPGEVVVDKEGSLGEEEVTITHTIENGKLTKSEKGQPVRTKEPVDSIVRVGAKPTEGEITFDSEQAFDIQVIEDPNMEAGKTEVIQEGVVGKTKTTVKIENSKEDSRNTDTIQEKKDKIITVGTKKVCPIPDDPKDPTDPTDPKDPSKPTDPTDPKDPPKPTDPTDPKDPMKPTDPTDPKNPKDPTKPTNPTDPKDPTKPTDPKNPNGHQTTGQPGTSNPTDDKPTTGKQKANSKTSTSPKTGDEMNKSLYAYVGGMLGAGLLALGVRKKRKQ
ncbi:MAG: G5 domain-containing protein, partial [Firmicutes bacterium]|nr:G5 domain-containing protein [Bacillota bacterium]